VVFGGWGSARAWTQGLHTCEAGAVTTWSTLPAFRNYVIQAQKVSSKPRNRMLRSSMSGKEPVLIQSHAWPTCATKWLCPWKGLPLLTFFLHYMTVTWFMSFKDTQ
jgi:hypothetical protein